jgi:hypothetical protein
MASKTIPVLLFEENNSILLRTECDTDDMSRVSIIKYDGKWFVCSGLNPERWELVFDQCPAPKEL